MLEASLLACIRGEREIFSALSFCVHPGEMLYLEGKNGSGKTSLLRILAGLLQPVSGRILWDGKCIQKHREAYQTALSFLGHRDGLKEEFTPLENLAVSTKLQGQPFNTTIAKDALHVMGLAHQANRPCRTLSQGQKRRVALARFVHDARPLWLLDEPFVGLDTQALECVNTLISAHLGRGGMMILTTHQPVTMPAERVRHLRLGSP